MRAFRIHDPKPRLIHAPCFRDRVLHHAIMAHVGPVLDRALVSTPMPAAPARARWRRCDAPRRTRDGMSGSPRSTCGRISPASTTRCCWDCWRASSRTGICWRCWRGSSGAYEASPGRGLPIGTLTSQHFANFYLDGLDRCLLEDLPCARLVRYMDDVVWWTDDRAAARAAYEAARSLPGRRLHLESRAGADRSQPRRSELLRFPYPANVVCCCRGVGKRRYVALRRPLSVPGWMPIMRMPAACSRPMPAPWRSRCTRMPRRGGGSNCGGRPVEAPLRLLGWPGDRPKRCSEARHPRRLVEQRRAQRACRVPQPQRPGEPQRQPWLSLRPSSRADRRIRP